MRSKGTSIPPKPNRKENPPLDADEWVNSGATAETVPQETVPMQQTEPTKRLTLDIPASLHRRIKATCAQNDTKMVDAIRELLEKHFGE